MRTLILIAAGALAVSACTTAGPPDDRYGRELQELADSCRARGGILAPTGRQSGRPELDNVCEIRGQAARAPSGG
jgi:hypothetical protein